MPSPGPTSPAAKETRVSLEIPRSGLGGVQDRLTSVPILAGAPEGPQYPGGTPGKYQVELVFVRPSSPLPLGSLSIERDVEGDSHIRCPQGIAAYHIASQVNARVVEFMFWPNSQGCLARASTKPFDAASFDDAENAAYRGIASGLSHWSAMLDVPIQVGRVYIHELATGARAVSYDVPFSEVVFTLSFPALFHRPLVTASHRA